MDPKPFTYEHFIQAVQSLKDDMLMYYIDEAVAIYCRIKVILSDFKALHFRVESSYGSARKKVQPFIPTEQGSPKCGMSFPGEIAST